jgi:hypothetical protein
MISTREVLEKAARYVAEAQPTIDRLMTKEAAFADRVEKTAVTLVSRGILNESKKAEFVRKCAENHTNILEFVEHLAKLVGADNLSNKSRAQLSNESAGNDVEDEQRLTGTLRNMQRKLIIEDLVVNDPVLSNGDPQVVITAYQTLVNVAPEVSLNKEIVRSMLRTSINTAALIPVSDS